MWTAITLTHTLSNGLAQARQRTNLRRSHSSPYQKQMSTRLFGRTRCVKA